MKCDRCNEKAQWVRCTQFAGDHHFCDLHALMEEDFGQNDSYSFWAEMNWRETMEEKKLYVVDVVSTFRMRYVVEAKKEDHAWDEVVCKENDTEFKEFSQHHIGTHIFDSREITSDEYLELFDKDNSYLSKWSNEQKRTLINKIDY